MANRGKDEEAYEHPDAACDQGLAATVVLDNVETDECNDKVDSVEDDLCDVTVDLDRLEDGGTVVTVIELAQDQDIKQWPLGDWTNKK